MPLLTRTFIKTAMIYFALALVLGILLAVGVTNSLFPVYIHLLVFGWLTQLIFGVVFWMFPKYLQRTPTWTRIPGLDHLCRVEYGLDPARHRRTNAGNAAE